MNDPRTAATPVAGPHGPVGNAERTEIVELLIGAYDTLEDLMPDPEFEDPDDDLAAWLRRAETILMHLTGRTARDLVDAKMKAERTQ